MTTTPVANPAPVAARRRDPNLPWNLPAPRAPLPGAVGQASVRFGSNFMAGGWIDVFADGERLGPEHGWASFEDAIRAARELTAKEGSVGIFQDRTNGMDLGFFARRLVAPDARHLGVDQASAPRVVFDPRAWLREETRPGHGDFRVLVGVHAVDHALRGIVAGDLVPQVSQLG